MARQVALLVGLVLLAGGCQPSAVISRYPQPNFNGPVIAAGAVSPKWTPAPLPPKVAPRAGGVPAGWIPAAGAEKRQWTWIVIHHSATPSGSAAKFNREHQAKGWDELGYHFVIGNGNGSGDGQVEVGPRWTRQKWGAHAKTPDNRFNEHGIGICLVGNFDVQRPSAAQMQSLSKLVGYLMTTYRIPAQNILGHGQTKATDCPGRNLSIAAVRSGAARSIASSGRTPPEDSRTASSAELLQDTSK